MSGIKPTTIAYADCFSGISGDMFLGALIDAGFPEEALRKRLAALNISGYKLDIRRTEISSLQATNVSIKVDNDQPARSWQSIRALLTKSGLPDPIKEKSRSVFSLLAQAEAKVHGCPEDEVHFHEIGGVDSIIDIVGTVAGLEYLGVDRLIASPLPMTRGWVECDHGSLPLPAPAVLEILHDVPVYGVAMDIELVTPTGAALLKALCKAFGPFPPMTMQKTGYGAGDRKLPKNRPNLFRLVLGSAVHVEETQMVEVIETNLDDWMPEGYPYLCEKLFDLGALDVTLTPIQMKKGRPGFQLRVLAEPAAAFEIKRCILSETTAIGLRFRNENRWTLPRQTGTISTSWGDLQVKKVETPAGTVLYPEYEACRRMAEEHGVPLKSVYAEVERCSPEKFKAGKN